MIESHKRECKELLTQRMLLAIIVGVFLQLMIVSCSFIILNINVDYTSWLQNARNTITSFRIWSFFCIHAFITLLRGLIYTKRYINKPIYVKNRFLKFYKIFTMQNVYLAFLYTISGGVLIWLHLTIENRKYSSLIISCHAIHEFCLIEEHYFLLLSGIWGGLYYFLKTSFTDIKFLTFPIVPLSKFSQLKMQICSTFPLLIIESFWPSLYFMVGYIFLGSYFGVRISGTASDLEVESLNNFGTLFNLSLFLRLWLYQLIFMLIENSMCLLYKIFLTQWVSFEFSQNPNNLAKAKVTLSEALSMNEVPIIQHLGYLDLVILAQKDTRRRSLLFTLSQPGGHPYNWNCILEKCLSIVNEFSADITSTIEKTKECPTKSTIRPANNVSTPKEYSYHMRNLAVKNVSSSETSGTDAKLISPFYQFIKNRWEHFIIYLLSKQLMNYIFGEQYDKRVQYILYNGQSIIWAIDSISCLSVLSLTEDSYGIVQKSLPDIMDTLLMLKQSLDKLQKSNILIKKQQNDDKLIRQMFTSLRSAVNRSIYRIITGFDDHITEFLDTLNPQTRKQLSNFLTYQE